MTESTQPSSYASKAIWKWFIRTFGLALFFAACLSHFWPFPDPYVATDRSDRKQYSPQTPKDEIERIEAEVAKLWKIIESKMSNHQRQSLGSPALATDITDLENLIGMPLPSDFKASLQIHNGSEVLFNIRQMRDAYESGMRLLNSHQAVNRGTIHPSSLTFTETKQWERSKVSPREGLRYLEYDTGKIYSYAPVRNISFNGPVRQNNTSQFFIKNHDTFLDYLRTVAEEAKPGVIPW